MILSMVCCVYLSLNKFNAQVLNVYSLLPYLINACLRRGSWSCCCSGVIYVWIIRNTRVRP